MSDRAIRSYITSTALGLLLVAAAPAGLAAGDLSAGEPTEVKIQLGDKDDSLNFTPNRIELETGRLYKLVLHNPSPQKHYFSSDRFADAVYSRKVQVLDKEGAILAEVKGAIREIEVYPGQRAEWWLLPVKTGSFTDLRCTLPGHAEKGMVGTVLIK